MNTKAVSGKDVRIGDMVHLMGRPLRVVSTEPYQNDFSRKMWPEGGVRIANLDTGTRLTLEPTSIYYITA